MERMGHRESEVVRIRFHVKFFKRPVDDVHQVSAIGHLGPRAVVAPRGVVHHRAAPDAPGPDGHHRQRRVMAADASILGVCTDAIAAALLLSGVIGEDERGNRIFLFLESQLEIRRAFRFAGHQVRADLVCVRGVVDAQLVG